MGTTLAASASVSDKGENWRLLRRYLAPQRLWVAILFAVLVGGIGLQLLMPQVLANFIDSASAAAPLSTLLNLALLYLICALVRYGVQLLTVYLSERVGWTATNMLRRDLAEHCLRLDMAFHHNHTPGEMIERIDGDVNTLQRFFSVLVMMIVANLLLLTGVLLTLFFEDVRVGVAFTLYVFLALFLLSRMRDIATEDYKNQREASAELMSFMEERLSGLEDIRANGGNAYTLNRLLGRMRDVYHKSLRAALKTVVIRASTSMLFSFGSVLALALGVFLYERSAVTLGTVYLMFAYMRALTVPVEQLSLEIQNLQQAMGGILRVRELITTQPSINDAGQASLKNGAINVTFENVTFEYEAGEPLFQNLSFELTSGKTLGLLGRTGSGKTTLTRLLLRFYDPQNGCIRFNGVDIRDLPLSELRQHIGIVTQDVQLFHASVRDNLTFFDPTVRDEHIIEVIQRLGLGDWFAKLPSGLDTELTPGGAGLSAGEAQLLALVRIFLKDPGLVILDEASSRLDPITERWMDNALSALLKDRTAIIIAHRLATVQRADDIMILQKGRIVERGAPDTLAADPASMFAQLLHTGHAGLEEVLA